MPPLNSFCNLIASFAFIAIVAMSIGQSARAEQPSADAIEKRIAQLGDNNFRTRERAAADLVKLGEPILPALRKAASAKVELEVKQRIDIVIKQIDRAVLEAEAKQWQEFDAPKRAIRDRMEKLLARKPSLTDDQLGSAIYLVTMGRSATAKEVEEAKKNFGEGERRPSKVLAFVRSQVQSKEFNVNVAAANVRMLEVQALFAKKGDPANPALVNLAKPAAETAASLDKGIKVDAPLIDVCFLLTVSRFPKEDETKRVGEFLKESPNRASAVTDILWALMNTKEFMIKE